MGNASATAMSQCYRSDGRMRRVSGSHPNLSSGVGVNGSDLGTQCKAVTGCLEGIRAQRAPSACTARSLHGKIGESLGN